METIHHQLLVKPTEAVEDKYGSKPPSNLVPKYQIFTCKIAKENLVQIFCILVPKRTLGIFDDVNKEFSINERKGLRSMDGDFSFNNAIIPQGKEH